MEAEMLTIKNPHAIIDKGVNHDEMNCRDKSCGGTAAAEVKRIYWAKNKDANAGMQINKSEPKGPIPDKNNEMKLLRSFLEYDSQKRTGSASLV